MKNSSGKSSSSKSPTRTRSPIPPPAARITPSSSPVSVTSRKFNMREESDNNNNNNNDNKEYDKHRFWLELSALQGILELQTMEGYNGEIINMSSDGFCILELNKNHSKSLPYYISRLHHYTEFECRALIRQLAMHIRTLHNANVAHRNLHIHNVLIDRSGNVQLRGLRYAKCVPLGNGGSFSGFRHNWYAFRAPETEGDVSHDTKVDVWSLGAILYLLLTGLPPFRGTGRQLTFNKLTSNIEYDMVIPSKKAQDLIQAMLIVNPDQRLSIHDVLQHPWMNAPTEELIMYDLSLAKDFLKDWKNKPEISTKRHLPDPVRFEV